MRVFTRYCYLALSLLLWSAQVHATLNIEIFGGGSKKFLSQLFLFLKKKDFLRALRLLYQPILSERVYLKW